MITHLEPDILECKVKWASGSIATNKASESDGIPAELFQILKDDSMKILPTMQKIQLRSLGQEDALKEKWQPTPVFLPGEFHGQMSVAGYSPWDCQELDTTER